MRRWCYVVAGALLAPLLSAVARAQDTGGEPAAAESATDRELRFVQGLRERGYFDLALEYTEGLAASPDTPADLKPLLSYEVGRGLLDHATEEPDLERRQALLEQARQKLDAFAEQFPDHPLTPEALVQLARLYVERGHTAMLQAQEIATEDEKGQPIAVGRAEREAKLAAARAAFAEARRAYDGAAPRLKAEYETTQPTARTASRDGRNGAARFTLCPAARGRQAG